MATTKEMNLGDSSTTVNLTANGNVVGANLKSSSTSSSYTSTAAGSNAIEAWDGGVAGSMIRSLGDIALVSSSNTSTPSAHYIRGYFADKGYRTIMGINPSGTQTTVYLGTAIADSGYTTKVNIGNSSATDSINLAATNVNVTGDLNVTGNANITGNLMLKGSTSGNQTVTTSNAALTTPGFSSSNNSQVWLLSLTHSAGVALYIGTISGSGLTLTALSSSYTANALTLTKSGTYTYYIKSSNSSISTAYKWTRIV